MVQPRRSSTDLRALLLKAAEDVFARDGYQAATTKDLAREAGVTESVLFRHFPSKAALFRESVLDPLMNVLSAFSEASARFASQPMDDQALMRLVMSELYDQLTIHRAALRSFVAAEDDLAPDARADFHRAIDDVLTRFSLVAVTEGGRRGRGSTGSDVALTSRISVGMIIALVVHGEWLLPVGQDRPSRDALIDHLTAFMLQGVGAASAG